MRHNSLVLWLVALVIFGPFIAATLIFYGSPTLDWLPRLPGSRELIEPPLAAPADWLGAASEAGAGPYRWSLIYARMAACEQQCARDLVRLRQVHSALGRDADHVQGIHLQGGDSPAGSDDSGLATRRLDSPGTEPVVRALGTERLELGRVLFAAPSGDLIASCPRNVEQKELLRDLKRLLSVSGTN
jgi:hypothetical protein